MNQLANHLKVTRNGARADVILARPDVRNAFDGQLIAALHDSFNSLDSDPTVRVIVLSGEGKVFCAGADVNWMRASIELSTDDNRKDALRMARMFSSISSARCPVIVRAHGAALGGGAGLVCASDITVASDDCLFAFSEVKLGILPAVISPHAVARIGAAQARRYFLTGERFGAEDALRIGMVHEVCKIDQLDSRIHQLVDEILSSAPEAVQEAKILIREVSGLPSPDSLAEYTADRIAARRASQEGQSGLNSFLERKPAPWVEKPAAENSAEHNADEDSA
ncbi:MAG: enoyl-CoA hydratase/isomerase family protein [Planctomycetes bacterium]|jgi:methylglutaconyl-CoA hydratase|nr:enoyl-CoA hydratase/isomerase family protein [Planctomycetota bacterium]MBT6784850.1 enoyl-CoA hydratase/isomerase family protein [Planctomycetota bacterium]MBT6969575.1 enoyl-CoA hydratase/isomerase family protein [Planctomycetota bacterium]MBT7104560.1 enoyl-CoA hydratase/isomerase family protein [Planctomycetota bacterium]MBT7130161.1 enoyl-CoA hydratase/isomerase family protein [Planctomycetota bacterium]